jgi:hypothetical protein
MMDANPMMLPVLLLLAQLPQEQRVAELLANAAGTGVAQWATLLMEADAAAVKLERSTPPPCYGIRCMRVQNFELTYRWNEIGRTEIYQHDLLALLAQTHEEGQRAPRPWSCCSGATTRVRSSAIDGYSRSGKSS